MNWGLEHKENRAFYKVTTIFRVLKILTGSRPYSLQTPFSALVSLTDKTRVKQKLKKASALEGSRPQATFKRPLLPRYDIEPSGAYSAVETRTEQHTITFKLRWILKHAGFWRGESFTPGMYCPQAFSVSGSFIPKN